MFFKKSALKIFKRHVKNCEKTLRSAGYAKYKYYRLYLDELVIAAYVCANAATFTEDHRKSLFHDVMNWYISDIHTLTASNKDKFSEYFLSRLSFYTNVFNNPAKARMDIYSQIHEASEDEPPFMKVAVAFSHCLLSIDFISNYEAEAGPFDLVDLSLAFGCSTFCSIEFYNLYQDLKNYFCDSMF